MIDRQLVFFRLEVLYHRYGGENLPNVLGQVRMLDAVFFDGGILTALLTIDELVCQRLYTVVMG